MIMENVSVKVMRSYDYCHFEVCLSASEVGDVEYVDELRKTAARLADKAVAQYKTAKENAERIDSDRYSLARLNAECAEIIRKPETERTPKEKAFLKAVEDRAHRARRRYDYQDEWEEEEFEPIEREPETDDVAF